MLSVFRGGPSRSRERGPPLDDTEVFRESFSLLWPAQRHVDTEVRHQRLLTSCAHRLRKPHRTEQTSGVLCRSASAPSLPRCLAPLAHGELDQL